MTETEELKTFGDLGVIDEITDALSGAGITEPFPIQKLAIPLALDGTDLIGQARTGTGKTLAFGVTLLQRLGSEPPEHGRPRALVIAPTRELALQVARDIDLAGQNLGSRVLTIYGGTGYDEQLDALASGVDVVVGTPGRLLDLANRRALDLSHIEVLVLDEADEMLDLGFLPDIERILALTPSQRQTLLFSATMPPPIIALARATLNRPINIRAEGHDAQATVPDIEQHVYQAHHLDKPEVVARILQARGVEKVIVFCRTKRSAQRLADDLADRGFPAAPIHGDLNQAARERALKKFRAGDIKTLVATDVASRGIDITGVSHVINYECPDTDATYLHRIGRTGRAGETGISVTLVDWEDVTRWRIIDQALELELGEPEETYSSSPHLYEELDIPEGTKGRIGGSRRPQRRSSGPPRDRSRRRHRSSSAGSERGAQQPRRSGSSTRRRRRRRAGKDVTDEPRAQ